MSSLRLSSRDLNFPYGLGITRPTLYTACSFWNSIQSYGIYSIEDDLVVETIPMGLALATITGPTDSMTARGPP